MTTFNVSNTCHCGRQKKHAMQFCDHCWETLDEQSKDQFFAAIKCLAAIITKLEMEIAHTRP